MGRYVLDSVCHPCTKTREKPYSPTATSRKCQLVPPTTNLIPKYVSISSVKTKIVDMLSCVYRLTVAIEVSSCSRQVEIVLSRR